jgi:hypothetical protein
MLSPAEIDALKRAISSSTSVPDIDRLERALIDGSLEGVRDLFVHELDPLAGLWENSRKSTHSVSMIERGRGGFQTNRNELSESRLMMDIVPSKRSLCESDQLARIIRDHVFPLIQPQELDASRNLYVPSPARFDGAKDIIAIDLETALCRGMRGEFVDCLTRLVVSDFVTSALILDVNVGVPQHYEVLDGHSRINRITNRSISEKDDFDLARTTLFRVMSAETLVICENGLECADALKINHSRWISINEIFQVHPSSRKRAKGKFYVRKVLGQAQVVESYLGEMISERLKHLPQEDHIVELNFSKIRLMREVARKKPGKLPILIEAPHRPLTLFISHIPPGWTDQETRLLLPTATEIEPIRFRYHSAENILRGETHAFFASESALTHALSSLTACTDVFVGWGWSDCGKVNKEVLSRLAGDFGRVIAVRIQAEYLNTPTAIPDKEESRPFGFVSMAKQQDALRMASQENQRAKDGITFHVKLSKDGSSVFKRVPVGMGEDFIEVFVM